MSPETGALRRERGLTLIEMLMVVSLVGLMVGVTYPAVSAGVDTLRLNSAAESIVSYLNSAMNRAERRQQPVEIVISRSENALWLRAGEPGFVRRLDMPTGVLMLDILPGIPGEEPLVRQFLIQPGGTVPRIGVLLANRRGARRLVRVDPITGAPQIERLN